MKRIALFTTLVLCVLANGRPALDAVQGQPAMQQGIKVHGRWTIDVRQPDGTLVSHTEFNNALTSEGGVGAAAVMGKANTRGEWQIALRGASETTGPCTELHGFTVDPSHCLIAETTDTVQGIRVSRTLVTTLGTNVQLFTLSGSVTATRNGSIVRVETLSTYCGQTVAPVDCKGSNAHGSVRSFTAAMLPAPIDVVDGQIVQVKVVISFS